MLVHQDVRTRLLELQFSCYYYHIILRAQRSDENDDVCLEQTFIIILRFLPFHSTSLLIVCFQSKPILQPFTRRFCKLRG